MNNYNVIINEKKLKAFLNWLPVEKEQEEYYFVLLARNKYVDKSKTNIGTFNSDKSQCRRFLSVKDRAYQKIKQLESPLGSYFVKGTQVPQEAIACYMTINPRDHKKATHNLLIKCASLIANSSTNFNISELAMSEVHKSIGTKSFIEFDIDNSDLTLDDIKNGCKDIINPEAIFALKTRGGFHILVKLSEISSKYKSSFYKKILSAFSVDNKGGDILIPIPGTYQGGFVPTLFGFTNEWSYYEII